MPKYKVKANISIGNKDFSAGEEYELTKEEVNAIGNEYLESVKESKKTETKKEEK